MNNPYDIVVSNNENATSFVELNDQYNALYNLLINNQRQISYLDLYKITEYVNTPADMVQIGSKFAQLNPNTAIGIGVQSVNFNGETFYQGDLLLKLSNGQMQKLDAPSHGIYFPSIKNRNKTLDDGTETTVKSIFWNYSKDEPIEGTSSALENNNSAKWSLYWDIPNVNNSNGYGQKIPSTEFIETNSEKLIFSGEVVKYEESTIVERKEDGKLYYYLFNLPNCCGVYIKEEGSTCYIAENKTQNFSSNKFVYHIGDKFVIKDQEESNDYLTINWSEEKWVIVNTTIIQSAIIDCVNNLVPIVKCFNQNNEEILVDIKIILPKNSTKYTISNIPSCVSYLMIR